MASTKPIPSKSLTNLVVGLVAAIACVIFMGVRHGWDRHSYFVPVPFFSGPSNVEIQAKLTHDGMSEVQAIDRWPGSESPGDQNSRKGTQLYPVRVRAKTRAGLVSDAALDLYFFKDDFGELRWYVASYGPGG